MGVRMSALRQEITALRTRYASLPHNSHERTIVLEKMREAMRQSLREEVRDAEARKAERHHEVEAARRPFVIVNEWPVENASPAFSWLGRIKRALMPGVRA